jgi:hypothetical protein
MDVLANTSYFLAACVTTAANPFITILLILSMYFTGNGEQILPFICKGLLSTLTASLYLSPLIVLLFIISKLTAKTET